MRITLLTYLAKERRGGRVRHAHQGMNGARNAPYKPRSLDVARRNPGATRGPGFHFIPSGLRLLDCYVFESLAEVRKLTEDWLYRYNHERPHEALGRVPPVAYRMQKYPNPLLLTGTE